jgi:hypothetical protein
MGERFNDIGFGSTYGMIEKYGGLEERGSDYYGTLRFMHAEFMKKYLKECQEGYAEAEGELKRVFLSKNL